MQQVGKKQNRTTIRASDTEPVMLVDDSGPKVDKFMISSMLAFAACSQMSEMEQRVTDVQDKMEQVAKRAMEWAASHAPHVCGVLCGPTIEFHSFGFMFLTDGDWHAFDLDDEIAELECAMQDIADGEFSTQATSRPLRFKDDHQWFFMKAEFFDADAIRAQVDR